MKVKKTITFAQVQAAASKKTSHDVPTVWWSSQTGWWTDDPQDLNVIPGTHLPCCAFGTVLYQGDVKLFLKGPTQKPEHYGKHGVNKFMAMHHKNIEVEPGDGLKLFAKVDIFEKAVDAELEKDPTFTLL